jgi:hypothetical protein
VVNALVNSHPALKAAVPQCPMIDGWMGDDWFHYGAFRQVNFDYFTKQMTARKEGEDLPRATFDDYDNYLRGGSAGDFARAAGLDRIPFWRKIVEHPAYDAFWQEQALDKIMAKQPLTVPTMWIGALWDQEDIYGAIKAYLATEPKDTRNDMNFLVLGPWRHSGVNGEQRQLNALKLPGDTATEFRVKVLKPFLDSHLKTNAAKANTPPVYIFDSGRMEWDQLASYPEVGSSGLKPLYLQPQMGLSFSASSTSEPAYDEYLSDPAKPVPYVRRPVRWDDSDQWRNWLTTDQRHVDGRPDVLTYVSEPLTAPLKISGIPNREHLRVNERHGLRLGCEADRCLPGCRTFPTGSRRLPARRRHGYISRPLPRELRASFANPGKRGAALPLRPAAHSSSLPSQSPHHGADPVHVVPALRPQPADVCGQYLQGETRGLPEGCSARLPFRPTRELDRNSCLQFASNPNRSALVPGSPRPRDIACLKNRTKSVRKCSAVERNGSNLVRSRSVLERNPSSLLRSVAMILRNRSNVTRSRSNALRSVAKVVRSLSNPVRNPSAHLCSLAKAVPVAS